MNEEKAKRKWCPFGRRFMHADITMGHDRIITGKALSVNRSQEDEPVTACLADGCMLWVSEMGICGMMFNMAIPFRRETPVE